MGRWRAKPWARVAVIVLALIAYRRHDIPARRQAGGHRRGYPRLSGLFPLRVFGYPAFLILVSAIGDIRISAVIVQTLIFLGSSVFLSLVVLKTTRSLVLTLALVVLLHGNIVTTIYNYIAVTESLVTSSAMVVLGALDPVLPDTPPVMVRADLHRGGAQHRDQAGRTGLSAVPDRHRALCLASALRVSPLPMTGALHAHRTGQLRLHLCGQLCGPRLCRHQQQPWHRPAGQGDAAGAETCR